MYAQKYLKYKLKYINEENKNKHEKNKNMKGGAITKKYIIADGTSSAGKTTLCKYFTQYGYKCIMNDDYNTKTGSEQNNFYKNIPNEYMSEEYIREWYINKLRELMVNDAINSSEGKAIFDDISQKELLLQLKKKNLLDDVFIIIVYANLETLARNLEHRRKEGDRRGKFAFNQFGNRYIKTESANKSLDIVNRGKFKQILLDNFKYEFENENELNNFANTIFKKMEIDDNNDHFIKLRDEFKYDYLLKTAGKTKEEIFNELQKIYFVRQN